VARLVDAYMESAERLRAELLAAVERRDRVAVARLCHALVSSSANLGAAPLASLCRALETDGSEVWPDIVRRIDTILAQLDRTLVALHALDKSTGSAASGRRA
jgi:two-component system, sensor histidine kinase and response regulator